jgi:hypothetical protein
LGADGPGSLSSSSQREHTGDHSLPVRRKGTWISALGLQIELVLAKSDETARPFDVDLGDVSVTSHRAECYDEHNPPKA